MEVSITAMQREIMRNLQEYAGAVAEDVDAAVTETAKAVRDKLKADSPKDTGGYAKSWTIKRIKKTGTGSTVTVYARKHYSHFTHLLEYGHRIIHDGKVVGKADPRPHIKEAERFGADMLERKIRESLS